MDFERQPPSAKQFRGPGGLTMWRLAAGTAVCEVAPSKGALVTRFAIGKDEILYLDPSTLISVPGKPPPKVRGGIPVLFPTAGKLSGDRYVLPAEGKLPEQSYPMRQHGLARQAAFSVIDVAAAHLTMELAATPATQTSFPFDFALRITVDVGRAGYRSLVVDCEVENRDRRRMPLHLGLHPYFFCPDVDKAGARVELAGTTVYDNRTGETRPYEGSPDFAVQEVDLHVHGLKNRELRLHVPGKPTRIIHFSPLFNTAVLWSLSLSDFLCVEPWSAPADALNTGTDLRWLAPSEIARGSFSITIP